MAEVRIVEARGEHVALIAARMRAADAAECWRGYRNTPEVALRESLACSSSAWVAYVDGEPAAMWGLVPVSAASGIAAPWLLTTDVVERIPLTFVRQSLAYVRRAQDVFPMLVNFVDARYTRALRWAAALGFTIARPEPLGPDGELFCRITLEREA